MTCGIASARRLKKATRRSDGRSTAKATAIRSGFAGLAAIAAGFALSSGALAAPDSRPFECPPVHLQTWDREDRASECRLPDAQARGDECREASPRPPEQIKLTHVEIVDFDGLNLLSAKPRVIYCGYGFVEKGFQTDANCRFQTARAYERTARRTIRTGVVADLYFCLVDAERGQDCKMLCTPSRP